MKDDPLHQPPQKAPTVGAGIGFERIRRITGYLVGGMARWNNAKRAEERDRVKHTAPAENVAFAPDEEKKT